MLLRFYDLFAIYSTGITESYFDVEVKFPLSVYICSSKLTILNPYKDTRPAPLGVRQMREGNRETLLCGVKALALLEKQD